MKIKDIFILAGGLLFTYLFYEQGQGINYLLFSVFLIAAMAASNPTLLKKQSWLLVAAATFFACGCTALYGNVLCFFTSQISFMLLAAYSHPAAQSVFTNGIHSTWSYISSIPYMINGLLTGRARKAKVGGKQLSYRWAAIIIPIMAFFVFLSLYSASNAVFKSVVSHIDLSFISFPILFFTILGWAMCHAWLKPKRIRILDNEEKKWNKPLADKPAAGEELERNRAELQTGKVLLILLNLLILAVNISDVVFFSGGFQDMENLSYPDLVHQGIGALILSIIMAIGILLYFFRGQLNFEKKAEALKTLAYVWIVQNIVMIAFNAFKNSEYIAHIDGLTYKRIGVYYYLLLSTIGLVFTIIKIYIVKPNWYLFRANSAVFFGIMVLSCSVNWDVFITKYNLRKADAENKMPDIDYLTGISPANLPVLIEWQKARVEQYKIYGTTNSDLDYTALQINERVNNKLNRHESRDWQSWNLADHTTYNYLEGFDPAVLYLHSGDTLKMHEKEEYTD